MSRLRPSFLLIFLFVGCQGPITPVKVISPEKTKTVVTNKERSVWRGNEYDQYPSFYIQVNDEKAWIKIDRKTYYSVEIGSEVEL